MTLESVSFSGKVGCPLAAFLSINIIKDLAASKNWCPVNMVGMVVVASALGACCARCSVVIHILPSQIDASLDDFKKEAQNGVG